jgi:hypothetical protein
VRPAAEVEGRRLRLDTACGSGAPACPKPDGGRFPNTEGRLLHHDAIPSEESLRAIHSAAEHGCHQAKDESCKTGRTHHQHHMQEQKAARQLSTPVPLTPHHTTTPPTRLPRGGSRTPVYHARPEAVPTYPLLASHARTSMHGTPASHAPRLPTSGPNPQTPACLVGCPPFPEQGPNGKTPTSPPIRIPRIANPAFVPFGNGGQLG